MSLVKCPDCGMKVSDQALACPKCGAPATALQAASKKKGGGVGKTVLVIALVLIGLMVVVGLSASSASKTGTQSAAQPDKPSVAQATAIPPANPNWAFSLVDAKVSPTLGGNTYTAGTKASGRFLVITLAATNTQKQTSNLNSWDFVVNTADGISYKPSSDGTTALAMSGDATAPKALLFGEEFQPGLRKTFRLAFDVSPTGKDYTLMATNVPFHIVTP